MTQRATVAEYMTPSPLTIGAGQTAHDALRRMRKHRIHHLPVLNGGEMVGVISERDVQFVVEMAELDDAVVVEDVMSLEPYCVSPETPLADAARTMANRRIGSAVVVQGRDVVGMLTSTDALYALVDQLEAGVGGGGDIEAHRADQQRLARHTRLRHVVATTDRAAAEVLAGDTDGSAAAALMRRLPRLVRVLAVEEGHEDALPGVAPHRNALGALSARLEQAPGDVEAVAASVHALLQKLRESLAEAAS